MKRPAATRWIAALGTAALLLVVAAGWGAAWIAGTTDGVRWLMDTLSRHTPLSITARTIEGRLLDRLQLGNVRVALAPVEVAVERLDFRWAPMNLLSGRITIKELTLTGMQIRDNTPGETPPDLTWPKIAGLAGSFGGQIDRLWVRGLTYRHLDGLPVNITTLSSSVASQKGLLSLSDLSLVAPSGRITGSIEAGLSVPSLRFDLAATPAAAVAGMDAFFLKGRFLPGRGAEQLAGKFTAAGSSGKMRRLAFTGEVGMTGKAFHLRKFRLTQPGRPGTVTGEGTVTPTAREPQLALQLTAAGLDLSPEFPMPTDLTAMLTLTGTPSRYEGNFTLSNLGKGWRAANLSGACRGDGGGVKLARLRGSLLSGSLQGSLGLRWRDGIFLEGTLQGRNLDPAGIDPDWTGVVNFDLSGNSAWSGQAPPKGKVAGSLLESRLHGQLLTGELQADFAGSDLRIGRLALQGKGFTVHAEGELGKRLTFTAEAGDLSRLIPRTAGELRAEGWVRWRDGRLDGSVTGRGANLAAGGLRVAAATLTTKLGEQKGSLPQFAAALHKAAYENFQTDSVTLEADGSAKQHTAHAVFQSGGAEARISLSGGYSPGSWQGKIIRFSGHDSIGPWNLAAPAALSIAAGRFTLSPLIITGVKPERLEIAGALTGEPPGGWLRLAWKGLNLARMNPWLTEVRATGSSSGDVRLHFSEGERPRFAGNARAAGTVTVKRYGMALQKGSLRLDGDEKGIHVVMEIHPTGGGMLKGAFSSPAPARLAIPETVRMTAEWRDIDLASLRRWLPDAPILTGRLAGEVTGNLFTGERVDLAGKASLTAGKIHWQKEKDTLNATLQTAELSFGWQGTLAGPAPKSGAGQLTLSGRTDASALVTMDGHRINLERVALTLDGNERGLHANIDLSAAGGGSLKGAFSSARPAGPVLPDEGEVDLTWTGIDLALLRPWLPPSISLAGSLAGRAKGSLLPGERFALSGDAALSGGKVGWRRHDGEINGNLRSVSLSWEWRGETLRGTVALALAERGEAKGSFQLPFPARLPLLLNRKGLLQAKLTGRLREQGILASFFPGLIHESHGELDADLGISGTWEEPKIDGMLKLAKAGAYLPAAGIHLKEVQLSVRLEKEAIRIDSFQALSGPGRIEGTALVQLKGWQMTGYRGSITGLRFQAVYLPELQLLASPNLTFEGTPERLKIRGEVRLPELLITGQPAHKVVLPSSDVIREGVPKPVAKPSRLALDVQVKVVLGERVLVKAAGIDARLDGSIDLAFQNLDQIASRGEIRVAKGRYKAYGVDLEIVRGRLFYAGGPLNQPTLDILALRTVGDVRAGVTAGGILRAPVIKLYSLPAMPDVDILAYIVFGHSLGSGSGSEQAALMAQVAGALLSQGQSVALQEQIKKRLGLSTLELQTTGETPGNSGYKPIPVAPAGVSPAGGTAGISQTMFTVGKYLTPQLYFSYGRSLFTGGNLFRLRYDIFRQWQIETQTGSESGVDLYYKIDLN